MNQKILNNKLKEYRNGTVVTFEQGDNVIVARIDNAEGHFACALGIYYSDDASHPSYFVLKENSLMHMNSAENGGVYGLRKATDDEVDLLFKKVEEYAITSVDDLSVGRVARITDSDGCKFRIQKRTNGCYNAIFGELSGNDGKVLVNVPLADILNEKKITSIKLTGDMEHYAFEGRLKRHCDNSNSVIVEKIKLRLYESVGAMGIDSLADILPYHAVNEYNYSVDSIYVNVNSLRTYINSQINSFAELDSEHDFNVALRASFATIAAHAIAGMQTAEKKLRNF